VKVAVGTNRYVDLCKGLDEPIEILEQAEEILMPFVVLGDLRARFAHGRRVAENERVLRRFLLKDGVRVMFADDQTVHHYASVFRQLRKQGTPVPTNDMWIAALALEHNLVPHARDKHRDHSRNSSSSEPHPRWLTQCEATSRGVRHQPPATLLFVLVPPGSPRRPARCVTIHRRGILSLRSFPADP
jgi:tRNA(fMet)-specific endonuclease VapC